METSWSVRRASTDDLPAVLRVLAEEGPTPVTAPVEPIAVDARQLRAWADVMRTAGLTVYLAEIGARPIGTASAYMLPHVTYDCRPSVLVEAVVVALAFRRRGVARSIMNRLLDDARVAGCHKVQLLSHKRHAGDGAHELYRALGFQAEAEGFRRYLGAGRS